jgi:hypothetical protein
LQDPDIDKLGHGPRLSGREYDRRVVLLHRAQPSRRSKDEERELRRRELDLMIDYRLGRDFPAARRKAMWDVAERVERRRPMLLVRHFLRRLWPTGLERGAAKLSDFMIDEYAKVLTPDELGAFLGDDPVD